MKGKAKAPLWTSEQIINDLIQIALRDTKMNKRDQKAILTFLRRNDFQYKERIWK